MAQSNFSILFSVRRFLNKESRLVDDQIEKKKTREQEASV